MTVFVGHKAVESPLDYLTEKHRQCVLKDINIWRKVNQFMDYYVELMTGPPSLLRGSERRTAAKGLRAESFAQKITGTTTAKKFGEAFARAGIQKLRERKVYGSGKRERRNYWNTWEIVAVCNWLRDSQEVGAKVGADDNPQHLSLDFKPFISETYRRKTQNEELPCKNNLANPATSLPNTFETQYSNSDHLSSSTTISNIIRLQDYKASTKDIFHSFLPINTDELYWLDLEMFSEDGLYPQYVSLAHRLIDYATYDPATHCLDMHYNPNRHGYAEWTESLFNSLADGLDMTYDDMLTLSISRFMCVTANPQFSWKPTRGAVSPGRILEDDDTIAHHICRNPACISPLHLKPLTQEAHVELHRYCAETDHPALNPSSYVEDEEKLDEKIEELVQRLNALKEQQRLNRKLDQTITSFRSDPDPFDDNPL